MSEYITHIIVAQDSMRLARRSGSIAPAFKQAIAAAPDAVHLGSATRIGNRFLDSLLLDLRDRWSPEATEDDLTRLAFVLGWVTHQAADGFFKPVYEQQQPEHYVEGRPEPSDVRIYHDVVLFHAAAASGRVEPFHPALLDFRLEQDPAARALAVTETEDLVGLRWQRDLLELIGALDADDTAFEDRLDAFLIYLEPTYVELDRYARAAHRPDPTHLRRFIHDVRFYDPADPLIARARVAPNASQRNEDVQDADDDLALALDAAEADGSLYARVLALSLRFLHTASRVFEDRAERDALRPILDAQPGPMPDAK